MSDRRQEMGRQQPTDSCLRQTWLLTVAGVVAFLGGGIALCLAGEEGATPLLPDSVEGGWRVFAEKRCIDCHAVWGLGGSMGPDLGRTQPQGLTEGSLVGTMWNHIPKMYSHMQRNHIEFPRLSWSEMSDLFSFLFFVRYLDEPGDPAAGEKVLSERGCAQCHFQEGRAQRAAPDLRRLGTYANPVVLAQAMWQHAPEMERAVGEAGMRWPSLDGTDLINIIAYVRSVSGQEAEVYLRPGSAKLGARLFAERKCHVCHRPGGSGEDLAARTLPQSLAAIASRMWNHAPQMTRMMQQQGVARPPLTAQEMSDIIAYVVSLSYLDRAGNPQRGRAAFEKGRCVECHAEESTADATAPALHFLGSAAASPVQFAHAMWDHGTTMMDRMSKAGIVWAQFQPHEMTDLIAYVRSVASPGPAASVAQATPLSPPGTTAPAPPIRAGESCVSNACHPGTVAARIVHAPAAQGECQACHALVDAESHRFKLQSDNADLCYRCHDKTAETLRGHGPITVGVCTACHHPHGADNLFGPAFTGDEVCFADIVGASITLETGMGRQASHAEPVSVLPAATAEPGRPKPTPAMLEGGCVSAQCHAATVADEFVHGPTASQECGACHVWVDRENHRFKLSAKEPDLCYNCHDRPPDSRFRHGPVGLGACSTCHDSHCAPNKFQLVKAGSDLCFVCHREMAKRVLGATARHDVVHPKGCLACHEHHQGNVKFNLKKDLPDLCLECHEPIHTTLQGVTVAHEPVGDTKNCINCHDPHGSNVPKMLSNTEERLCLDCHNKPMDTPNGPIIDMNAWIAANPERHGPIREGNCTGCHQPHGAKYVRLLQQPFPSTFYSPFSIETYGLCFQCHEETLVLDERTVTLTNFRNGDKNLHYFHVNQKKGRTCRACHEIHAGTQPLRMKDFVPFGQWKYPVNFELTANGGRCAPGCHAPYAYDRQQEIIQRREPNGR